MFLDEPTAILEVGVPVVWNYQYDVPMQRRSKLPVSELLLNILLYLPRSFNTLLSVSHTCRAWRERARYLPHWKYFYSLICASYVGVGSVVPISTVRIHTSFTELSCEELFEINRSLQGTRSVLSSNELRARCDFGSAVRKTQTTI